MIVADVNLIAYLHIPGPFTEAAEQVALRDASCVAPRMWRYEFLNVLATHVRAGGLPIGIAVEALKAAQQSVATMDREPDPGAVIQASIDSKLATYDCEYAVLARELGLKVVTADQKMLRAFADVAVDLVKFGAGH